MPENINSTNQNGGITAHTVNIGATPPVPTPEKPKPTWKTIGAWVIGTIAFVASVVKVLDYFEVKPTPKIENKAAMLKEDTKVMNQSPNINVTSHNQSGGITAHTVNLQVDHPTRNLSAESLPEMKAILSAAPKLEIALDFPHGDTEAQNLAGQIKTVLRESGLPWNESSVVAASEQKGVEIRHGNDAAATELGKAIFQALSKGGVTPKFGTPAGPKWVMISVGKMP